MAFTNVGGLTYISPGGTVFWWYDRNGGQDFGVQFAGPDVRIPSGGPNDGPRVEVVQQSKAKFNSGYTQYYVTFKNVSSSGVWHNLQGGGLV